MIREVLRISHRTNTKEDLRRATVDGADGYEVDFQLVFFRKFPVLRHSRVPLVHLFRGYPSFPSFIEQVPEDKTIVIDIKGFRQTENALRRVLRDLEAQGRTVAVTGGRPAFFEKIKLEFPQVNRFYRYGGVRDQRELIQHAKSIQTLSVRASLYESARELFPGRELYLWDVPIDKEEDFANKPGVSGIIYDSYRANAR